MHPHSEIVVICREESEINEPIKWLEENHLLQSAYKIDSSDKSIEYLKKIASIRNKKHIRYLLGQSCRK